MTVGTVPSRYDSSCDPKDRKYTNQATVYNDLGTDVVNSCFDGYNACLFAYGRCFTTLVVGGGGVHFKAYAHLVRPMLPSTVVVFGISFHPFSPN